MREVIKISNPIQLVHAAERVLGFTIEDSVVILGVGERPAAARFDLFSLPSDFAWLPKLLQVAPRVCLLAAGDVGLANAYLDFIASVIEKSGGEVLASVIMDKERGIVGLDATVPIEQQETREQVVGTVDPNLTPAQHLEAASSQYWLHGNGMLATEHLERYEAAVPEDERATEAVELRGRLDNVVPPRGEER